MWFKTQKQLDKEIQEILWGQTGDRFFEVDLVAGPDRDKFLENQKHEPVLRTDEYVLVRLPEVFDIEGYDVKVTHVKSFSK